MKKESFGDSVISVTDAVQDWLGSIFGEEVDCRWTLFDEGLQIEPNNRRDYEIIYEALEAIGAKICGLGITEIILITPIGHRISFPVSNLAKDHIRQMMRIEIEPLAMPQPVDCLEMVEAVEPQPPQIKHGIWICLAALLCMG